MAKFLVNLNSNYKIFIEDNLIKSWYIINKLYVSKFKEIIKKKCIICYEKSDLISICNHDYCLNCINILHKMNFTRCAYCRGTLNDLYSINFL